MILGQLSHKMKFQFHRFTSSIDFGKLLAQLDPDGTGWDGTYNGSQMPATDYWFKILYIEGNDSAQKEYKAHFSLKR